LLLIELLVLLQKFQSVFSQERVFVRVRRQALGVLLALGSRTVARVLAAMGRDQCDWSTEYRLFSRSPWNCRALFEPVLREALAFAGAAEEPLVVAGDFTHLPKTGKHIAQVTCMRDPMSPAFHTNLIYGLRFFQLTLLCPFRTQDPALATRSVPIRFEAVPVLPKPGKKGTVEQWKSYRQKQKQRPTSKAARATIEELRADLDRAGMAGRPLLSVLDGSFCNRVFMEVPIERVDLLCRTRKDAVLCHRAEPGQKGFYGKQTFTPEQVRQDESIPWQTTTLYYGGRAQTFRYKEVNSVLWQRGGRRRKLRLLVLAPTGYRLHVQGRLLYRQPAYLLTTDLQTPAPQLILAYLDRWQIEVNHREEKSTMGVGDAQVRNKDSVPKQPAFVVAIYSMLLLAALKAYGPTRTQDYLPPPKWARRCARPSCLDILALLRAQVGQQPEELQRFEIETSAFDLVIKAAA
jgi:DDE superfamily endonuclease